MAPESALRDHVIFVEGAPRSGTTALVALLALHPRIAGVASEAHLFDQALAGAFNLLDGTQSRRPHLAAFVSRGDLVDLARQFSDGVLDRMRQATRPQAEYIVEKTPAVRRHPEVALSRKFECYPDAWYVHIVRDEEEVVRSLMRLPMWTEEPNEGECRRWWQDAVTAVRGTLGGAPRYREVDYADLNRDPVTTVTEILSWLGLTVEPELRDSIKAASRERFAPGGGRDPLKNDEASDVPEAGSQFGRTPRAREWRARARRALGLWNATKGIRRQHPAASLATGFRRGDQASIGTLMAPTAELAVRTALGDRVAAGPEVAEVLAAIGHEIFAPPFVSQWWGIARGRPFSTVVFSGLRPDGRRVDLSMSVTAHRGRVSRIGLIIAGSPSGRASSVLQIGIAETESS